MACRQGLQQYAPRVWAAAVRGFGQGRLLAVRAGRQQQQPERQPRRWLRVSAVRRLEGGDGPRGEEPSGEDPGDVGGVSVPWLENLMQDLEGDEVAEGSQDLDLYHRAYIHATSNNTHVTITDNQGNPVKKTSAGMVGFKKAKRGTAYAAQVVGQQAAQGARDKGIQSVRVLLKGVGAGRLSAIKGFQVEGLGIASITDITPTPHGGCRPKKTRRL